ncbi:MAG: zinc-binding dehydrogenase, partial [Ramlibacter sp.]
MDRAIEISRYGGPEEMKLVAASAGEPGPGEIRIRHHAIGVNFTDVYHRTGVHPVKYPMPMRLGMEGAGIVEAVGAGVAHLRTGDRAAYASHPPGSYSDVRVMPAQNVCRLPDGIGFEEAAAVMLKGLTVQCLMRQCLPMRGLHPGDHVLFHAAAGGVGLVACQWARALGLNLIATAGSAEKCALALAHGAAHAIDYREERFVERLMEITQGRGVKVVYDSV